LRSFMCLRFDNVFFWPTETGVKAAHKMLVKLTKGLFHFSNL
jgi:hypothetical protein